MSTTSYGKITIIDVTDVGNFSVYPYANGPNTQIYSEENQTYYPDWSANGSHLVLTPVVTYAGQDKTTEATVNWYLKTDLEHPITTGGAHTVNNSTKQLTIAANIPTANTYIVYVVKASYNTETGAHVEAEGEITFSLLTQPSSIKNVSISGNNVIKYASNSSTPNPSFVTLTATLTGGNNITGDGWKYWDGDSWENATGVTGLTVNGTQLRVAASYNNNAVYFTADVAQFKYVAHASSDNTDVYEDIFSVYQLRDGATGNALIRMDLTNDDQLVPINASGNAQWGAIGDLAGTTVYVYEGRNDITSDCSINVTLTNVTVDLYNGATKYSGQWSNGDPLPTGYHTVKVTGFTGGATTGSVYFSTTANGLNYSETFSLVGAPAGTNGNTPTIYSLEFPSIPAHVNNPTGSASDQTLQDNWTYSPVNLTINAYKITTDTNGTSTRSQDFTAESGCRVYYKPNIVNGSPGTGDSEWGVLNLTNGSGSLAAASKLPAEYSPYTFRLVLGSATNVAANIKDEECINIVADGYSGNIGNSGKDAINLLINNENVTLNCTESGKTRSTTIVVGYQGYVGATESSDFTYKGYIENRTGTNAIVSGVTQQTSNGKTYLNIGIAGNKNVNAGETGTITLNFNYKDGQTGQVSISKIISWDAKLDAKDGGDAIVLTFEYGAPSGQHPSTYFKNKTGSTTVTPVLVQNGSNLLDGETAGSGYGITWTNLITGNNIPAGSLTNGKTLTVNATDISGVGSYSCTITYPLSSGSTTSDTKTYKQYVSFTDYSDPLQVELISTIGDKITNGVGEGVVYPQTTRDGITLDQVSNNSLVVWSDSSAPSNPAEGDFYFNTTNNTLYERSSSSWVTKSNYTQIIVLKTGDVNPIEVRNLSSSTYPSIATPSNLTYVWSFRDRNGDVLNPQNITDLKVSYINGTSSCTWTDTQVTGGQFVYINNNVIDNKITILCQVTKN